MPDDNAPADDLRSILSASFDDAAKTAAPEPVAPKVEAEPAKVDAPADDVEKGETRERGPDGKFLKKAAAEDKPEPKADDKEPKAEPKPDDKPAEGDGEKKPTEAKPDGKEPPARWSPSAKAMFKLQTPEAQAFLLDRHADMEREFTKRNQEVVDLKKEYGPVQQMFAPHLEVLKQKGLTPQTVIQRWGDVETRLASGDPAKQIAIISGIIHGYGIDKAAVGRALGFTSTSPAPPSTDPADQTDPAAAPNEAQLLAALEAKLAAQFAPKFARIDQFEQNERNRQNAVQQSREAEVETKITNFKSATDQSGELLHPFYDEVEPAMTALAQSYVAMKMPIPDLDHLYETAVQANPSTRQALLATQRAAQEAKSAAEARAKAASARKAGSSVTGAPGSAAPSRPLRGDLSLREQLEEAASDLG